MNDTQRIEWKESWRDECLKSICGFANAEGGVLVIGRNDKGVAVGVKDARKLLQDIPNKVRDILGIIVDVNLRKDAGKETLEKEVGSTNQALKGAALDRFLMRKIGRHCQDRGGAGRPCAASPGERRGVTVAMEHKLIPAAEKCTTPALGKCTTPRLVES